MYSSDPTIRFAYLTYDDDNDIYEKLKQIFADYDIPLNADSVQDESQEEQTEQRNTTYNNSNDFTKTGSDSQKEIRIEHQEKGTFSKVFGGTMGVGCGCLIITLIVLVIIIAIGGSVITDIFGEI